jgi:hypothetical protein
MLNLLRHRMANNIGSSIKPIDTFPYTIHFTFEEDGSIIILRVFNTDQQPIW